MNRAQRRANERAAASSVKMMKRIEQHGITPDVMAKAEKKQYNLGWNLGVESATYQIYAALMLTAAEDYGMDSTEKLRELLMRVDRRVVESFDYREDALNVWKRFGIRLLPDEAFNRIGTEDGEDV